MSTTMIARASVVIAADREKVWKAITQPQYINEWFNASATSDAERVMWQFDRLEPGAPITFSWQDENGQQESPGAIAMVEPPERFAFRWVAEPHYDLQNLVTFVLETVPEGTSLTVTEQGFESLPQDIRQSRFEKNAEGWRIQVSSIATYVMESL